MVEEKDDDDDTEVRLGEAKKKKKKGKTLPAMIGKCEVRKTPPLFL